VAAVDAHLGAVADVVVIGAGPAGIAAALELMEQGRRVVLLERAARPGGRTLLSVAGPRTRGHIYLGCCRSFRDLLDRLGTSTLAPLPDRLQVKIFDQGREAAIHAAPWPAPWHLWPALRRYPFLSAGEKGHLVKALVAVARGDAGAAGETFAAWLERRRQTAAARSYFWDLIAAPALNAPAELASAQLALMVFRLALLGDRRASAIAPLPADSAGLFSPIAAKLAETGGELVTSCPVKQLEILPGGGGYCVVAGPPHRRWRCRAVVAAVAPGDLVAILPERVGRLPFFHSATQIPYRPLLDLRLTLAGTAVQAPVCAIPGRAPQPALWIFPQPPGTDGRQDWVISISNPEHLIGLTEAEIAAWVEKRVLDALPVGHRSHILHLKVFRRPQATFSPAPEHQTWRPPQETPLPGLFVAGDWTATGWPSTMESAVLSGQSSAGKAGRFLAASQ